MPIIQALSLFALSFGLVFSAAYVAHADTQVSFAESPLWLDATQVLEGEDVRVSTVVMKKDAERASGTVDFYAGGIVVGSADFSLSETIGGAVVGVSFSPKPGTYAISAKITKVTVVRDGKEQVIAVAEEIKSKETLRVALDTDRDAIPNETDTDDDGDGVSDANEVKTGTNPLLKEVVGVPEVAGAATSSSGVEGVVAQAKEVAGPLGARIVETSEGVRTKGAEYFKEKVAGSNVAGFASSSIDVRNPMGILEMVKNNSFKAGAFVFGNVYAFYLIALFLILWMLRKLWKRHSLN